MAASRTTISGYALQHSCPVGRLACILFVLGLHGLLFAMLIQTSSPVKPAKSMPHTVAAMLLTESTTASASQESAVTAQDEPIAPQPPSPSPSPSPSIATQQVAPAKQQPAKRPSTVQTKPVSASAHAPAVAPPVVTSANTSQSTSQTTSPVTPAAHDRSESGAARTAAAMIEPGVHCPQPTYPKMSRRLQEEGLVTLRFLVGTDGHVLQTEIASTSGFSRLDDAARTALSQCQFRPAMQDGQATQSWTAIKYLWRLQ